MSNIEQQIIKRLDAMERRIQKIESKEGVLQNKPTDSILPDNVELGYMKYAGRYVSDDGTMSSIFGDDNLEISDLFKCNSFEMAKVIDAFSSEERINIVKELIKNCLTARELMERLKFQTTGKLYHHLSFLEKIGVIRKDGEQFHVSARYINCIVLIFAGVQKIISKNNFAD